MEDHMTRQMGIYRVIARHETTVSCHRVSSVQLEPSSISFSRGSNLYMRHDKYCRYEALMEKRSRKLRQTSQRGCESVLH